MAGFINDQDDLPSACTTALPETGLFVHSVGALRMPPTLLLSPQFKTNAPSAHFIIVLCGRAKSAARPVIHPNPDQEHTPTILYARNLASMLVSYAGMVLNRALVESTNRGFMLNEGKAHVLPDEAVGASERRNATERKIADPNTCQFAARRLSVRCSAPVHVGGPPCSPRRMRQSLRTGTRPNRTT